MTKKLYIRVDGIYCEHCIETIKLALRSLDGVKSSTLRQNVAEISGESLPRADVIIDTIRRIGYETDERKISANRSKVSRTVKWYEFLLIAGAIIVLAAGVRLIFGYNVLNVIPAVDSSLSYGMLFVTGLLTSIHCAGIETILMGMLYGGQVQTMMPKLHSTNFEGMELIRPMYFIREDDVKHWRDYNGLHFLQCACKFTDIEILVTVIRKISHQKFFTLVLGHKLPMLTRHLRAHLVDLLGGAVLKHAV